MTGKVVSNKMTKALIVEVATSKMHAKYKKAYKSVKRYAVACEDSKLFTIGQLVEIVSCRPVSKTISFKIAQEQTK
jgi:small subunit ribosomal protein S17